MKDPAGDAIEFERDGRRWKLHRWPFAGPEQRGLWAPSTQVANDADIIAAILAMPVERQQRIAECYIPAFQLVAEKFQQAETELRRMRTDAQILAAFIKQEDNGCNVPGLVAGIVNALLIAGPSAVELAASPDHHSNPNTDKQHTQSDTQRYACNVRER